MNGRSSLSDSLLSIAMFVALVLMTGCGNVQLESSYRHDEITIDGNMDDWEGLTTYIDDMGLFVGLANDDDNLYLALRSRRQHPAGEHLF